MLRDLTGRRPTACRPVLRPTLTAAALVGMVRLLMWAAPALPPTSPSELGDWLRTTPSDQAVTGLAAGLGWLCLCWLVAGALLMVLGSLPGYLGRTCRRVGATMTPLLVRRVLEGVLGTALASGTVAAALPAGAAVAQPGHLPAPRSAPMTRSDGWPDLDRSAQMGRPAGPPAAAGQRSPAGTTTDRLPAPVTVRAGDSLWDIARRQLGGSPTAAAVAAAWPRWYAVNRSAVGPDPDLLHPGQRLQPPE